MPLFRLSHDMVMCCVYGYIDKIECTVGVASMQVVRPDLNRGLPTCIFIISGF